MFSIQAVQTVKKVVEKKKNKERKMFRDLYGEGITATATRVSVSRVRSSNGWSQVVHSSFVALSSEH